jgi:hypothetical protein
VILLTLVDWRNLISHNGNLSDFQFWTYIERVVGENEKSAGQSAPEQ